ncbi:hypothetical protein AAVH_10468 [Aphelenchoides avenae]|nr:hypothetical protein AAVH_10468 [Aphelenchus avenae]
MRTFDVNAAAYTANCTNNQQCIESMGHSAGCYAILRRTHDGVLQIQAGSVVNSSDVAKLYPKDIDENGKEDKIFSQFRKFVELNSSVVLICAMANMSACNHYYHRMLYVYHAHVHPTGYNAMDSTLVQSCTGASDGRACLREDNCFLDVDLGDKSNQEGQCYRRSGWTSSINQSSTICDTFNSSDHCYAVQRDTGEVHLLCCCVDGCSNDIGGQSAAYGFRIRK